MTKDEKNKNRQNTQLLFIQLTTLFLIPLEVCVFLTGKVYSILCLITVENCSLLQYH
ncbi:MAG: hypothetical protein RPR97_04995 [Colwellia sp.]